MIEFKIVGKTSSLNESFRGDWRKRHGAAKSQRAKVMKACPQWPKADPLLVVRLTRVSPGTLDDDALPAALKHFRDGVAGRLKIDDASPLVRWDYAQAKGEAAVIVQVFKEGDWRRMCGCLMDQITCEHDALAARPMPTIRRRRTSSAYEPPRARPVDAARLAEDTFAPEAK